MTVHSERVVVYLHQTQKAHRLTIRKFNKENLLMHPGSFKPTEDSYTGSQNVTVIVPGTFDNNAYFSSVLSTHDASTGMLSNPLFISWHDIAVWYWQHCCCWRYRW